METEFTHRATVVVIGGGQAGLSAGYHLAHRGFVNAFEAPGDTPSYVVLDAEEAPGGAWRHRWESLTMATVNNIFDLPSYPRPTVELATPSKVAIPEYFAQFEAHHQLAIQRPVTVHSVEYLNHNPEEGFRIATTSGTWQAKAIVNATGTWNNPTLPYYPGQETFHGKQMHTKDYVSLEAFAGQRVGIIGGGISAVQQLEEISRVATVHWFTRREPVFRKEQFELETTGREVIAKVTAAVEAGKPTGSVVSYTGLGWTPYARAAKKRGVLNRKPMFTRITPTGVIEEDGTETPLDVLLWATGFKPAIRHLEPLGLQNELGAIQLKGTKVVKDPRIHLVGYGPTQSTVGANRAGRIAGSQLKKMFLT